LVASVAKGVIPTLGAVSPEFSGGGERRMRIFYKRFLLYGRHIARLAAFVDRFVRTPALKCSAEAAPWFNQTHVRVKVTAFLLVT
jgi:hypothetical protein